jgi:hypothetical protein
MKSKPHTMLALKAGADVNYLPPGGLSPLMNATEMENVATARLSPDNLIEGDRSC